MAKKPESQNFVDMFANLGKDLKLPSVDVEQVIEHHRKNLEALQKSASTASSGAATVMARLARMEAPRPVVPADDPSRAFVGRDIVYRKCKGRRSIVGADGVGTGR